MINTTQAALVALLMAGAALPAFAQTMQPTTQPAQDQTAPVTPEQATPDQTAPADQAKGIDTMKRTHIKKAHHLHHRHRMKTVTQAKANAGDTTKADTAVANPGDAKTDSTGQK